VAYGCDNDQSACLHRHQIEFVVRSTVSTNSAQPMGPKRQSHN